MAGEVTRFEDELDSLNALAHEQLPSPLPGARLFRPVSALVRRGQAKHEFKGVDHPGFTETIWDWGPEGACLTPMDEKAEYYPFGDSFLPMEVGDLLCREDETWWVERP
jgi:hypothetical protein